MIGILSAALWYLEYKAVPTFDSMWCGLGALHKRGALQPAPMAYRVLALPFVHWYQAFKLAGIFAALTAVYWSEGAVVMWIAAALLPLTFWYDYWDWSFEVAGLYFAMSGNLPAAFVFAILWALSRETAPMAGVAYWLATGDIVMGAVLSAAACGVLLAVRLQVGKRPLYCDRFMLRVNNKLLKARNERAWVSVALILCACAGAVVRGRLDSLAPLALIIAGVTMGKLDETRLFSAAVPMAAWLWWTL